MAKKITLKDKEGTVLCPHTAIEQVEGLQGALDGKLGESEKAASAASADIANTVIDKCISTSKIVDAAITSSKIALDITLNGTPHLTVEPTVSSPDTAIASVGLVKDIVVGYPKNTRNLLSSSKEITVDATDGVGTRYAYRKLPISVSVGDELTFHCEDFIVNAGTGQNHAILLYANGTPLAVEKYISPTSKTATIKVTKASDAPYLYLYAGFSNSSAGKSVTYKGVTLVKGDTPLTHWVPSAEDNDLEKVKTGSIPAGYANAIRDPNYHTYSTRRTSANVHYNADGGLHYFLATGSITDNSAPEGHIIHCEWDNAPGAWLAQLLIKHGSNNGLLRRYTQGTANSWSEWITMLDDKNFDKYALPLTGGTLTGDLTATNFIGNLQGVADVATTLYDDDSGTYKEWKDIDTAITSKIGDQFEDYATKEYVDDEITSRITGVTPSNATETGAGIVRAATQVEVLDGHVNDNDPDEMAFVRPETLQAKLDDYVKNGEANFTGPVNITGTDSTQSKLTFARETFNYIAAKGKIGIAPNNTNQTSEYGFWFSKEGVIPGTAMSNSYNLGSSSVKWRNVYAYTFNGTATAVADGCISTSKIVDAAITPVKIQTSIALNGTPSMTIEPTTSSPDKTIASVGLVKEVVDSVEIGVKNLILNSDTDISSSANFIVNISLSENLVVGDMYTITLWATLGSDRTHFSVYPEWGMGGALSNLTQVSDGVFRATFVYAKGDATNANKVGLYQLPSTGTTTSIIDRMKIEKGNKATDWTPAPEDVEAKIEAAKPTIFLQALQPSATEVKDGDIWIIQ